jgi:5-methyltetrahydropteroyltriglutamate--homocysteine methyltransferase
MQMQKLMTSSIGSFPRPKWLARKPPGETRQRGASEFLFEGEQLQESLDDAVTLVLREQDDLGIDIVTDGELRRANFIFHIAGTWEGIDTTKRVPKEIFRNRAILHMVPPINGKIRRRGPSPVIADTIFAKAHTKKPLKMQVPGPMTVIDSSLNQAYDSEEDLAMEIADALNAELRELQAAGCDMIQIDEPAMTRYHDKTREYGAAALDRCIEGITVPTVVHLCYGYPGTGEPQHHYKYEELLPHLMETRIGGFTVEFGRSPFDPTILEICGDRIVLFGCVDPGDTPVEAPQAIAARVRDAMKVLDPHQIVLTPDCGLVTISRPLAHAKLAAMVKAAEMLR